MREQGGLATIEMATSEETNRVKSRKERAQQTHDRLIAAAVSLFSQRRYDDVSVSEIAASTGVAHGVLFHHFSNKRGIYLEAMRKTARELDMTARIKPGLPLAEQLQGLLRWHLEFLGAHEGLALRLVLGGRGADPEAWELFEEGRWRIVEWFCNQLRLDSRSHAVRMMIRAGIGAIDEATIYWLQAGRPCDIDTMARALTDLASRSLLSVEAIDPTIDIRRALIRTARPPGD